MLPRRWWIAILVTAAIAISYLDRLTLSVAIGAVRRDIPISDVAFSWLHIAFLVAYGVMYMVGGRVIDALGTRRGFFVVMVFWSLACASHGLAAGFAMLAASRFALGLGEGGGFPAATKAVAEWFPVSERASAMGLINAGTAVGSVIAPPLIARIILHLDWRWVFFLTGAAGLAWTAWWLWDYHAPADHPRISPQERDEILARATVDHADDDGGTWLSLLGMRAVWGLVVAKFLSDGAWFFYSLWLPKYLMDVHGFDTTRVGLYAWIPYAAAGVRSLLGGAFSSWLLRRGWSLNAARKIALGLSAALMPWVFFVTVVDVRWALVLFSVAFFGQQSWSTLVMTLPADLFPRRLVGSAAGLVGFGGAMGGVTMNLVAGMLLDHYLAAGRLADGYRVVFGVTSTLHVVAFLWILLMVRRAKTASAPS
ncbi:MAG TPA: MFS transporter [Lacipirellulaceae bacterium]|nr:MFS transporter [Lacipirellulaceae bacterium]